MWPGWRFHSTRGGELGATSHILLDQHKKKMESLNNPPGANKVAEATDGCFI